MKKLNGNLYKAGETATNYSDFDFPKLVPGAYVCKFTHVQDNPNDQFLYMEYDICEGPLKDYYKSLNEAKGFWGGNIRMYYSEKAQGIFGRMCKATNISNPGFEFNPFGDGKNADERTLIGKKVGMVLHEEEYYSKEGELKSAVRAQSTGFINVEKVKTGEFNKKLLEKKAPSRMPATAANASTSFLNVSGDSEEIPFN